MENNHHPTFKETIDPRRTGERLLQSSNARAYDFWIFLGTLFRKYPHNKYLQQLASQKDLLPRFMSCNAVFFKKWSISYFLNHVSELSPADTIKYMKRWLKMYEARVAIEEYENKQK